MPPKPVCPTSVQELSPAAKSAAAAGQWNEFVVATKGCTRAQQSALYKEAKGTGTAATTATTAAGKIATSRKRGREEEPTAPSPAAKKTATKATATRVSPASKTLARTPPAKRAKTPRKVIAKSPVKTPAKAPSPVKTPTKGPSPKKASPAKKTPSPAKKLSPAAVTALVQSAAFTMAAAASPGVDLGKCVENQEYACKCLAAMRKKFPTLLGPECKACHMAEESAVSSAPRPPPPPPPPPPVPKKSAALIREVAQEHTGASSLLAGQKGIVGLMAGVTLRKVQPPVPGVAFQAIPVAPADASTAAALAQAPNATAAQRKAVEDVASFTQQILAAKLKKTSPKKPAAAKEENPLFAELLAGKTLRVAEKRPAPTKEEKMREANPLMAALSKAMDSRRAAWQGD